MMVLKRFRVTNFRSIMDSGWIDCDDVTALVGINEAGKSNVILALWKLNPVRDGKIELRHDMPTKNFSAWRSIPEKFVFITAEYALDNPLLEKVVALCQCDENALSVVSIQRKYNGEYNISFSDYSEERTIPAETLLRIVSASAEQLEMLKEKTKAEAGIKEKVRTLYSNIIAYLTKKEDISLSDANCISGFFPTDIVRSASSEVFPHLLDTQKRISSATSTLRAVNPADNPNVKKLILSEMPSFVYYSNYGNLDTQIYLPHAIKWLNGETIDGIRDDAKVRTLRVLFDFVKLDAQEVLDLGEDPTRVIIDRAGNRMEQQPTVEEIDEAAEKKATRANLLNSASSELTRTFREWWKQGNYVFRFQADGEFFKIWVSDDKRPEEIELERRSTGLQWFLSFFLVFLVESQEAHKGCILLLDEAGLSLHSIAQKDLITFFDNLAKTNQLIYTTHSPFLVDTSNIDRAKVVYSNSDGLTVVSSDLRASDDKLNEKSVYAVHAALGLSVSDILIQGCQPIIVEGPSDQNYLNAIKLYLLRKKEYAPNMELMFMPSGGVRGVRGIVSIVCGKNDALPLVIVDSDQCGRDAKKMLLSGLYQGESEKVIDLHDIRPIDNCEIEDLIPIDVMKRQLSRLFRDVEDEDIIDVLDADKAIVPQIEAFANKHGIALQSGWKVDLSRGVKQQLQRIDRVAVKYASLWIKLFEMFNI